MKNMSQLGTNVSNKATFLKNKTQEFMRNMDSRINIDRMEEEIEELYMDIGETVCRYFDAGEKLSTSSGIKEKYKRVSMLKKNIRNRKKIINANMKDSVYCEDCGEILDRRNSYCHICGRKIMND